MRKKRIIYFCYVLFTIIALSCSRVVKQAPDPLVLHIDSTINPADDFFLFANGKWFKQNPIPASEESNGIMQLVQDTINEQIRNICESSAKITINPKGSNKQKIGDFFFSGMDSDQLNKRGITDIRNVIDHIEAIRNVTDLVKEAAYLHAYVSSSPLFNFWVGQDDKISSKNAIFIWQGGLSLPDRNYYFDTDNQAVSIRKSFIEYMKNMFGIMGYQPADAQKSAAHLMKLETALAGVSRKSEDTRDPLKNYHKLSLKNFLELTPDFDWKLFLKEVGIQNADSVIVGQPEFLTAFNGYLKSVPIAEWKNYLKFHLIVSLSPFMDDKTRLETFHFYATILRGIREPKPRWKRVVGMTDHELGELIGQIYVNEYLPKGTKEKLLEIGTSIRNEYATRIQNLDWMSASTKEKALRKLNSIIMKAGYPDKWKDLSSLEIDRTSYVHNVMNANRWAFQYMILKYGKPVDRTEWGMEPQTYNAYYNPSNNEIVVPGCNIIIPGFERKLADDAILYSVIGGSTFGHEITHGFDDQGSKYDETGNLHNWWLTEDSVKFYKKTKMIVKQFATYIAVDSLHINGELTQGENIADLGGVVMGYEAFRKTGQYKENKMIAGLTPDQRYFLGYALAWMVNERPEAIANQVRSNEHSPAKYRLIGPITNMPEFYRVFGVKEGTKMWRPDSLRITIW